jgi:hypothetical protein
MVSVKSLWSQLHDKNRAAAKDSDNDKPNQNILTASEKMYSINKLDMDSLTHMSNGYGAQPISYFTGTMGSFLCCKAKLTIHLHPVLRLTMSGGIPLHPMHLHGMHRDNFTFTYAAKRTVI